jgi:8-oxo-dGTP pyrophosphatase MutT (NUDIX family)
MADSGQAGGLSPSTPPSDGEPLKAAGILLRAPDGQILLLRRTGRDHTDEWAFPGGGVEDGETAEECARRELLEETALTYKGNLSLFARRIRDGVDFSTFIGEVEKFPLTLNAEHDRFLWADRDIALAHLPLHPGAALALQRLDMDELGIAKAIAAGELVSPQRYGNVLLVSIRITGTGAAYRQGIDEYVWRDPSLYLNDEFLQRCNGLPVIWEHPKGRMMDSKEFNNRVIGSIMLPFIKDDGVWGIAKIYDDESAEALSTEQWSTSPGVRLQTSVSKRLEDGSKLLIEGKPSLLDHVAICALGVWDVGGPPTGVDVVLDSAQPDAVERVRKRVYAHKFDVLLTKFPSIQGRAHQRGVRR